MWDCRDPDNREPAKRSGQGDMPPNQRVNAGNMREGAEKIGWTDTDRFARLDTGLEARSGCALDTMASYHKGLIQSLEPGERLHVYRQTDRQTDRSLLDRLSLYRHTDRQTETSDPVTIPWKAVLAKPI